MKKLLVVTFMLIFAFQSVGLAAVSGSKRSSAPKSSPSISQPSTGSSSTSTSTTSGYKPSAPASSYSDKAPAAATKTQQQAQQSTGSSFLRNAGMFGGGMLLGSMLGSMFGFGSSGMFASIMGMLFNVMAIGLLFMAGRYLWNRFQESRRKKDEQRLR
ncbi:MAG: hypothetical protein H6Q65_351 [Firmicutes bacterium]|nr:hypothetical protein [Bacillota bacterium]